jgi:hypothetical protein
MDDADPETVCLGPASSALGVALAVVALCWRLDRRLAIGLGTVDVCRPVRRSQYLAASSGLEGLRLLATEGLTAGDEPGDVRQRDLLEEERQQERG